MGSEVLVLMIWLMVACFVDDAAARRSMFDITLLKVRYLFFRREEAERRTKKP